MTPETPRTQNEAYAEILREIRSLRTDGLGGSWREDRPEIPLIDPTANVSNLVELHVAYQTQLRAAHDRRQDDLRKLTTIWRDKIDIVRENYRDKLDDVQASHQTELRLLQKESDVARNLAEQTRLDAKLADIVSSASLANEKLTNAAAVLATQTTSLAETLRTTVATAAQQQTDLVTQLRDTLSGRLAGVEANQQTRAGGDIQRTETKQASQWSVGLIVMATVGVFAGLVSLVGVIALLLNGRHP